MYIIPSTQLPLRGKMQQPAATDLIRCYGIAHNGNFLDTSTFGEIDDWGRSYSIKQGYECSGSPESLPSLSFS